MSDESTGRGKGKRRPARAGAERTTRAPGAPLTGGTDWMRLRTMTPDEVERNASNDPDNPPRSPGWLAAGRVRAPEKEPVSLRVDADVLAWFRSYGRGWQTAINEILRAYMEHHSNQDTSARAPRPTPTK